MFISVAHAAEAAGATPEPGLMHNPEFWVAVVWVLVVIALYRPVSKALTTGLDTRRDRIKARIEEAERLRDEAQELLNATQKRQRDAHRDADDVIARARTEAQRQTTQAASDLETLLARRERQAQDRITQAETDAINEVRNEAVEIALAAATKLIAESLTPAQAAGLIDAQVAEMPGRLN